MRESRPLRLTLLLFASAGLLGPVLHCVWPAAGEAAGGAGRFVADFVALLWPTQPLAVMESSTGPVVAFFVAAAANAGVYTLVGWAVRGLAGNRKAKVFLFLILAGGATGLELLWAGYDWRYVRHLALVAALLFHAALFVAASRLRERGGTPADHR